MLVEHYGEVDFVYDERYYYDYRTIDLTTFNDEGKMFHIGHWDERLHAWIQNKLGIDYKKPNDYRLPPPSATPQSETNISEHTENTESRNGRAIAVSKLLFGGVCRVEGHEDGLYLRICSTNKLVLLVQMEWKYNSSIWINPTFTGMNDFSC